MGPLPTEVRIDYTNHRGQRAERRIVPDHVEWAEVEWHPGAQWLLIAYDLDRAAYRTFAMKDIHRWEPA